MSDSTSQASTELERGIPADFNKLPRIPSLAQFISQDNDAAIYRKFDELGARNLLYLQSNLNELEAKLRIYDEQDKRESAGDPDLRLAAMDYGTLKQRAQDAHHQQLRQMSTDPHGDNSLVLGEQDVAKRRATAAVERVTLHKEIKVALRDYREAVIQEQQVKTFKRPTNDALSIFKRYFYQETPLLGHDQMLLDNTVDLIAIAPSEDDRLAWLVKSCFGWAFRDRKRDQYQEQGIFYYSEGLTRLIGNIIITMLGAMLLLGAMATLSIIYHSSWKLRLGMVALWTASFAFVVGLFTTARRSEVLGATAAYAAVLVVYVSGNIGPAP